MAELLDHDPNGRQQSRPFVVSDGVGKPTEHRCDVSQDGSPSLHRAVLAVAGFIVDRRVVALSVVGRSAAAIPALTVSVTLWTHASTKARDQSNAYREAFEHLRLRCFK